VRWLAASLCVACLLGAWPAQAEPSKDRAEALFREGIALATEARYAEAVDRFRESHRLDPARGTLLAWAVAEERAGRLGDAYQRYVDLLAAARSAGDAEREAAAAAKVEELAARVGRVAVGWSGASPRDCRAELDDTPLPCGPEERIVAVTPGDHRVRARARGHASFDRTVAVPAGGVVRVEVRLSPEPTVPRPDPAAPRDAQPPGRELEVLGWISIGAGAVAAGAGTYLWAKAGGIHDEIDAACAGDRAGCAATQRDRADTGETLETAGIVAWVGGGALVAAGVAMLIVSAQGRPRSSAWGRFTAAPAGLRASF
jgi:hypothetical protein